MENFVLLCMLVFVFVVFGIISQCLPYVHNTESTRKFLRTRLKKDMVTWKTHARVARPWVPTLFRIASYF